MSLPVNNNNNNNNGNTQQSRKMERRKAIRILSNSKEAMQIRRLSNSLLTSNNSRVSNPNSHDPDNDPYSSDSSVEVRITMRLPEKKEFTNPAA